VQRYLRDLFRLAGEIIVDNFERSTLQDIVGKEIPDQILLMLRDDADRAFKVDIETDSTIAPDEMQQKQDLAEFMGALANFMPAMQQASSIGGPQAGAAILLWAIRRFRAGREVEEILEAAIQNPPQQGPSPEQQQMQAEMQAKQADQQMKMQEMQAKLQMQQQEQQLKLQAMQQEYQLKLEQISQEIALEKERFSVEMQQKVVEGQIKNANLMSQGAAKAQAMRNRAA
jgi:flagellar motor protein MotB